MFKKKSQVQDKINNIKSTTAYRTESLQIYIANDNNLSLKTKLTA